MIHEDEVQLSVLLNCGAVACSSNVPRSETSTRRSSNVYEY